jgi:hypothetical protein
MIITVFAYKKIICRLYKEMSSGIVAAFSPNDFYFMKATNMPDAQTCETLMSDPPTNCDKANAKKTNPACVNTELCKNKENANNLYNLQNNMVYFQVIFMFHIVCSEFY